MSHDLAILGIRVDARDVLQGRRDLEAFTRSGRRAGATGQQMGQDFERGAVRAQRSTHTLAGSMRGLIRVAKMAGGAMAAIGAAQLLGESIRQARGFGTAMAEVSTITSGGAGEMSKLREAARDMAKEFGTSAADQAKGLYQAISAGATDASEAVRLMDSANKLAIGGLTDTATAVEVLSGALNTYGKGNISAAQAADALFVAVRQGVTTIPQLSSAIGRVLPMAKALGMSFDEAVGATAALTKNAMTTAEAVTSLNAILTAVAKPTAQAADLANYLGLEFGAAALQAQGFAGFMANIEQATGGNVEQMATLLGSVEAVKAGLLFAGEAGQQYAEIMEAMSAKTGAASTAFGKMSEDMQHRLNKVSSALNDLKLGIGALALELAVPVLETLVFNLDVLGMGLAALAATKIPAAISGLASLAAWLATSEGLFIAGAVAARGMAIAMNTIPWVAAASLAMGLYAKYKSVSQATRRLDEALEGASKSQKALNTAVEEYNRLQNLETARGWLKAGSEALAEKTKALKAAEEKLREHNSFFAWVIRSATLGYALDDTKARQTVEKLKAEWIELSAEVSSAEAAVKRFAREITGGDFDDTIASVGEVAKLAGRVSSASVPAAANAAELAREYGTLADAARMVAQAQHALGFSEAMRGAVELQKSLGPLVLSMNDGAENLDQLRAAVTALSEARGPAELAQAFAGVADEVAAAAGGVDNMDADTRGLYQSTILVVAKMVEAAQAAREGEEATHGFSGALSSAAAEAAALAANLGAAALGAERRAEVSIIRMRAQIDAIRAGQNEAIAGSRAALDAERQAFVEAQRAVGLSASEITLAVNEAFEAQYEALDVERELLQVRKEARKATTGSAAASRSAGRAASRAAREAEKSLTAAQAAARDLEKTFRSGLTSAIDGVGQAFGDLFTGGIKSFKDFAQRIWGGFRKLLSDMIATAVANPIKISLGLMAGTGVYAGTPGGPVGGGLLGGLMGGAGSLFGGIGTGLSSVVGGFFSGGFGGAASAIGTAFSGIGSGIAGVGTAIGAALPVVGLAIAAFSLFRARTTELDRGLRVTIDSAGTLTETFRDTKKTWLFGLFRSYRTEVSGASEALASPIRQAVNEMRNATLSAADAIGASAQRVSSYTKQIRVSTKGMGNEEAKAAILKELSGVSDDLAELVIGSGSIRAGETATQALSAMQVSMQTINIAFKGLGLKALAGGVASANAARAMMDAAGGVQNFAQAADLYFQHFYSVGEQAREIGRRFREGMENLGVGVLPSTIEQFRGVVDRLNVEGRNAEATGMIALAPLFKQWRDLEARASEAALRETRQLAEQIRAAQRATVDLLRKPLRLDSERFNNRYEAAISAAFERDAEIAKQASSAQLGQLILIRAAIKEIRDEQRDANLRRTDA